jgi:6-phosphogluconolactonase
MIYRLNTTSGKLELNNPPSGRIHAGAAPRHLAFGKTGRFAYVNGEADMTIAACTYDPRNGALEEFQFLSTLPEGATGSNFSTAEIEVSRAGDFVYVSNRGHDSIAIFAIDPSSGRLTARGHVPTGGRTPRNFAITARGDRLYAANQESDSIVHFDINPTTGELTPNGEVTLVGAPVCVLFR